MRALIVGAFAVAGLMAHATLVQAAPIGFHIAAQATPPITQVVQRCGHGFHREAATPDNSGVWHGHCVANAPKKQPEAATPPGSSQSAPHS
jgi:hypothetical protein